MQQNTPPPPPPSALLTPVIGLGPEGELLEHKHVFSADGLHTGTAPQHHRNDSFPQLTRAVAVLEGPPSALCVSVHVLQVQL